MREDPGTVAEIVGNQFTKSKAERAAEYLKQQIALEGCTIDLIDLLGGRGFPKETAKRAVKEWGNWVPKLIRKSPYVLMRFRGCGFLGCDRMYQDLGGNPARLKRQALCAWYILAQATATSGNTWHPVAAHKEGLAKFIGGAKVRGLPAARLAKRAGLIASRKDDQGNVWLADARKARNEAAEIGRAHV